MVAEEQADIRRVVQKDVVRKGGVRGGRPALQRSTIPFCLKNCLDDICQVQYDDFPQRQARDK
jgi:hypothetical protein